MVDVREQRQLGCSPLGLAAARGVPGRRTPGSRFEISGRFACTPEPVEISLELAIGREAPPLPLPGEHCRSLPGVCHDLTTGELHKPVEFANGACQRILNLLLMACAPTVCAAMT
jgi:hypothetical protein